MSQSPFLNIPPENWLLSNELAFAIYDGYPVTTGHVLVLTRRVVPTWFDASAEEQAALMSLVNRVKQYLDENLRPQPAGYNVGFNVGEAAGQTQFHAHIHVIPRYPGDMPDPRGGVRHVIPDNGNYLINSSVAPTAATPLPDSIQTEHLQLVTGYPRSQLWDQLSDRLIGANHVDVLASFVQNSGLDVIEQRLFQLLRRTSTVRIMVSDYLSISDPRALKRLCDWQDLVANEDEYCGLLKVRLIEVEKLPHQPQSFHPKSWRIIDSRQSFIAVGSSNLSRAALVTGIEWNLLSTTFKQMAAHDAFGAEYNSLWDLATSLTPQVVDGYTIRSKGHRKEYFEAEVEDDRFVPDPRPWQIRALASLQKIRDAGYGKALVAVATGMGKTWLAAFDVKQVGTQLGRRPRVIVIAHRSHILVQAESALSTILDDAFGEGTTSWYIGSRSDMSGTLVIGSVQKLARPEGLARLGNERFDYAIIDEVHHAEAHSYRQVMARLDATFVLGLTATPERGDGVDVAGIFDDNLAYHATIGDGIAEESLVPFHYIGIRDSVDFAQIPWRNGRFDMNELEKRVEQSERMQRLKAALLDHPGDRTIVFCCSKRHALFARDWLENNGFTSAAVFSGPGSDGQIESLEGLRTGRLQTLCAVDMFNEGLDIPLVDRVIMLRPTESKVIFIQQLGRGLRAADGKTRLLVIDFVGNHRIFAQRILHLLSLGGRDASWADLRKWVQGEQPVLPPGCLLDVKLEDRDVIREFIPSGSKVGLETYRILRDELGRRPLAGELFAHSILPKTVSQSVGSWFQFVEAEGDLKPLEKDIVSLFRSWLIAVETTSLNKSYKMVVLRVLLDHGILFEPIELSRFAQLCRRYMLQHPVLRQDLLEGRHALDHQTATDEEWATWWREWPIDRWLDVQNGQRWFAMESDTLRFLVDCPDELRATLQSMTDELVEWRLAAYTKSHRLDRSLDSELSFEAKVSHTGGRPILFFPDTTKMPDRPVGLVNVRLPDKSIWQFKFVKIACNVASPLGSTTNELGNLLKSWFGDSAGLPGTDFKVVFSRKGDEWTIEPMGALPALVSDRAKATASFGSASPGKSTANDDLRESKSDSENGSIVELTVSRESQYRTHVPVYDLVAAGGGWGPDSVPEQTGWMRVIGHRLTEGMFVARVEGASMEPTIPSGSWCLFRPCPAGSRDNRLVLVQLNTHIDPADGGRYTVKRYRSTKQTSDDGWQHQSITLEPLNSAYHSIELRSEDANDLRVIGEFVAIIEGDVH